MNYGVSERRGVGTGAVLLLRHVGRRSDAGSMPTRHAVDTAAARHKSLNDAPRKTREEYQKSETDEASANYERRVLGVRGRGDCYRDSADRHEAEADGYDYQRSPVVTEEATTSVVALRATAAAIAERATLAGVALVAVGAVVVDEVVVSAHGLC